MVKAYDKAVLDLIKVFAPNIIVMGLQNDDSEGSIGDSTISQAGAKSEEDKISFPIISVFRNPEIEITDASQTKRDSTFAGYSWKSEDGERILTLACMRSTLTYTIDVFDVTRAAAEELATRLFFRLRNNPQIEVNFEFEDFEYIAKSIADIELDSNITNSRLNDKTKSQVYKIRFSFKLVNANIYDIIDREALKNIEYTINVRLDTEIKSDLDTKIKLQ